GVTSRSCTGWLPPCGGRQLLTMVLPLARRQAGCVLKRRVSGTSVCLSSHTDSPAGFTSRTKLRLLVTSVLPFLSRAAAHGLGTATDQISLPTLSYSTTFPMSMCATKNVPAGVTRAWRNCGCTFLGLAVGRTNSFSVAPLDLLTTSNFAGSPFCTI